MDQIRSTIAYVGVLLVVVGITGFIYKWIGDDVVFMSMLVICGVVFLIIGSPFITTLKLFLCGVVMMAGGVMILKYSGIAITSDSIFMWNYNNPSVIVGGVIFTTGVVAIIVGYLSTFIKFR